MTTFKARPYFSLASVIATQLLQDFFSPAKLGRCSVVMLLHPIHRSILYTLLCRIFLCLEQILLIVHIIENDLARSLNHLDKWSLSSCHWILSLGYAKVLVLCRLVFLHEEIPVSVGCLILTISISSFSLYVLKMQKRLRV